MFRSLVSTEVSVESIPFASSSSLALTLVVVCVVIGTPLWIDKEGQLDIHSLASLERWIDLSSHPYHSNERLCLNQNSGCSIIPSQVILVGYPLVRFSLLATAGYCPYMVDTFFYMDAISGQYRSLIDR
jgi:hypothetical protein